MNKNKLKKLMKNKKIVVVSLLIIIGIICSILLNAFLSPNGNISNYGNRLDGIKEVKFNKSAKNKVIDSLNSNDRVSNCKINIHGKIINVIFNVSKDTSVDDARNIANESLNNFTNKVKSFYDIQYIITNTEEEGTKQNITDDDGKEKEEMIKNFPIIGYKNSKSEGLVW